MLFMEKLRAGWSKQQNRASFRTKHESLPGRRGIARKKIGGGEGNQNGAGKHDVTISPQ